MQEKRWQNLQKMIEEVNLFTAVRCRGHDSALTLLVDTMQEAVCSLVAVKGNLKLL